jgi:hypothetical protein
MNHDITSEAEAMKKPVDGERIMERRAVKLHFDDEDMDFNLMWVLGQSGAGGAELGECPSVASQIKDPEGWVTEWTKAGQRLESQAQAAEQTHHLISAREAYLRAFSYYQASVFCARPQDKLLAENWRRATSLLQKAAASSTHRSYRLKCLSNRTRCAATVPGRKCLHLGWHPHPDVLGSLQAASRSHE